MPIATPSGGFSPYGTGAQNAANQRDAEQHDGQRGDRARGGPLPEEQPRGNGHEHDLQVGQHRCQARADGIYGVLPKEQIGEEQDASEGCDPAAAPRASASTILRSTATASHSSGSP